MFADLEMGVTQHYLFPTIVRRPTVVQLEVVKSDLHHK